VTNRKHLALENEILRGVVGSTAHGINIEGQDDRDEMGVFIEPADRVCGLTPCDHYIYRDKPEGVRSEPGDLDLTMYSLRKYCRLATQGNPSVLVLLWLPNHVVKTAAGEGLVALRRSFISREAGQRFLGYLVAQKMKLKGERAHTVNRPELVEKYGYDTKFAMHALRLGFEGIELLTNRRLTLPVAEPNLSTLRAVRTGQVNFAEALKLIEDAETRLRDEVGCCAWEAERGAIDRFMVAAHTHHWQSRFSSMAERPAVDGETTVQFRQPGPIAV
jgi:predicted nucleotidyltransferase